MAGNIKVIKPGNRYEPISKGIIFNKEVDTLALGLFVRVITFSDKWELNIKGLSSTLGISEDKVRKCMAQLENAGYLKREREQGKNGKFTGWNYTFINTTDIAKTPTSDFTDDGKTRISENGYVDNINNNSIKNNNSSSRDNKNSTAPRFDFKAELIKIGISPDTADQWLEVRKAKRAVNTKIAFKDIATEMAKVAGATTENMAQFAVRRSWAGFKAEWYNNATKPENETRPQPAHENYLEHNRRIAEELQRQYQQADEQF